MKLTKIDEDTLRKIIGEYYRIPADNVSLYSDYEFVKVGNDKVRRDYIYGIVQTDDED